MSYPPKKSFYGNFVKKQLEKLNKPTTTPPTTEKTVIPSGINNEQLLNEALNNSIKALSFAGISTPLQEVVNPQTGEKEYYRPKIINPFTQSVIEQHPFVSAYKFTPKIDEQKKAQQEQELKKKQEQYISNVLGIESIIKDYQNKPIFKISENFPLVKTDVTNIPTKTPVNQPNIIPTTDVIQPNFKPTSKKTHLTPEITNYIPTVWDNIEKIANGIKTDDKLSPRQKNSSIVKLLELLPKNVRPELTLDYFTSMDGKKKEGYDVSRDPVLINLMIREANRIKNEKPITNFFDALYTSAVEYGQDMIKGTFGLIPKTPEYEKMLNQYKREQGIQDIKYEGAGGKLGSMLGNLGMFALTLRLSSPVLMKFKNIIEGSSLFKAGINSFTNRFGLKAGETLSRLAPEIIASSLAFNIPTILQGFGKVKEGKMTWEDLGKEALINTAFASAFALNPFTRPKTIIKDIDELYSKVVNPRTKAMYNMMKGSTIGGEIPTGKAMLQKELEKYGLTIKDFERIQNRNAIKDGTEKIRITEPISRQQALKRLGGALLYDAAIPTLTQAGTSVVLGDNVSWEDMIKTAILNATFRIMHIPFSRFPKEKLIKDQTILSKEKMEANGTPINSDIKIGENETERYVDPVNPIKVYGDEYSDIINSAANYINIKKNKSSFEEFIKYLDENNIKYNKTTDGYSLIYGIFTSVNTLKKYMKGISNNLPQGYTVEPELRDVQTIVPANLIGRNKNDGTIKKHLSFKIQKIIDPNIFTNTYRYNFKSSDAEFLKPEIKGLPEHTEPKLQKEEIKPITEQDIIEGAKGVKQPKEEEITFGENPDVNIQQSVLGFKGSIEFNSDGTIKSQTPIYNKRDKQLAFKQIDMVIDNGIKNGRNSSQILQNIFD
jgi:hypothetical protein